MNYISYGFIIFLIVTVMIYYIMPLKCQKWVLLIASLVFYTFSGIWSLLFMIILAVTNWILGLVIQKGHAKICLFIGTIINLILLFGIKWSMMGSALINKLLNTSISLTILMPLGFSFFLFQNMSYLSDIYRNNIPAESNVFNYILYSCYFPYIVSGPINRYENIHNQITEKHIYDFSKMHRAVMRILYGFIKKMVLADRAAIYVDEVFTHYYMYRGCSILLAVFLFVFQLYMDFSGCTDIVLGISELFGIEMIDNFKGPFLARNTAEFWRRWHISLSTWFRDYIYIPLGGNRRGKIIKYANIMIVFIICGAWHGAGFTFLIWGALNGIYQVIGDFTYTFRQKIIHFCGLDNDSFGAVLRQRVFTFLLGAFAWLFFRADGLTEAVQMCRRMFVYFDPWTITDGTMYQMGLDTWDYVIIVIGCIAVGVISYISEIRNDKSFILNVIQEQSWIFQLIITTIFVVILFIFGIYGPGYNKLDFIYYGF